MNFLSYRQKTSCTVTITYVHFVYAELLFSGYIFNSFFFFFFLCRSWRPVHPVHVSYRWWTHQQWSHYRRCPLSVESVHWLFYFLLFVSVEASLVLVRRRTRRRSSSISLTSPPLTRPKKIRSVLQLILAFEPSDLIVYHIHSSHFTPSCFTPVNSSNHPFPPCTLDLLIFILTVISMHTIWLWINHYIVAFKLLIFYRKQSKIAVGKAAQKDHQGKMCGNENNDPAGTENSSVHSGPPVTLHIDQRPNLIYYVFGFTSLFTATCQ